MVFKRTLTRVRLPGDRGASRANQKSPITFINPFIPLRPSRSSCVIFLFLSGFVSSCAIFCLLFAALREIFLPERAELIRVPVFQYLGNLLLVSQIALTGCVDHDCDTNGLTTRGIAKLECDPSFYIV